MKSVKEYSKLTNDDKQHYLATLSRDELIVFMQDVGYQEGLEDGRSELVREQNIIDKAVIKNSRVTKFTSTYMILSLDLLLIFIGIFFPQKYTIIALACLGLLANYSMIKQGFFHKKRGLDD